jgi:amidophosphoribosyltransferase
MSTREEMVAHGRTVDEIAEELGADSLGYLSLEGVYEAIQAPRDSHCDACFSGDFPLERTNAARGKFAMERVAVVATPR